MNAEDPRGPDPAVDELGCLGPVDWPARLEAEAPFLESVLAGAPSERVLDLGCGTGEHAHFLAARGFEVVGIDGSEARLERARAATPSKTGTGTDHQAKEGSATFLLGEIGAVESGVRGHFGAALCLGNTLAQMIGTETVARMIIGLRRRMRTGAPLVIQLWNFERIFARRERDRPMIHRFGEDGRQRSWLGLLAPRADGMVALTTSVLEADAAEDPPLRILASRTAFLHGWTRQDLDTLLDVGRFRERRHYGGMDGQPFHPIESTELVIVAR